MAGRRTRQQQQQQQQQLQAEGWRQQQQQQQGRGRTTPLEMAAVGPGGRPLKVAIAGGGVGGLATAYYMLKKGMDVTVYEKTAQFSRAL